ncbi:MAG: hypothetical protein V2A73_14685, partial [Pseudomonadota bacterium]
MPRTPNPRTTRAGRLRRPTTLAGSLLLPCLLWPAAAAARVPPTVPDPREGVWIGAGESFVQQAREQWSVFRAPGAVNKMAVDGGILWIATDDGVVRFDTGNRRSTLLTMDDGFPSQRVSSVAVDQQFVWFGTNKGIVRYRKLDRSIRTYGEKEGLPHQAINDALAVGRQVWFATRAGIAVYDVDVDGFRSYTAADGLQGEDVAELFQVADDVWMRTDGGLSRFRIQSRVFTSFAWEDLRASEIRSMVLDGDCVWVGTDKGLLGIELASDAIVPFPQMESVRGASVIGVEPFADYLFVVTDAEVVQYHKLNRSLRHFTEADGLVWREGAIGTVLLGGYLVVLFDDGAWIYDAQRDLWSAKTLAQNTAASDEPAHSARFFGKLNLSETFDLRSHTRQEDRYANAEAGAGVGLRFSGGRTLDASVLLDYGQLEPLDQFQYRDLQYGAEYVGSSQDLLRKISVADKLEYRGVEEGLERTLLLQGGDVRLAAGRGQSPKAGLTLAGGQRRGVLVRDFLSGPRQEVYQLSKRWILPGSERIYVDGELLTNGTDYTIIYPAGKLAFLDPDRVDDLSVIEAEYEHDLEPKKGLGVMSILDMLPAAREVGDWVHAGEARLIREESGLYQQIDGAAPKYIDRGWVRSVYAEYRQGSRT